MAVSKGFRKDLLGAIPSLRAFAVSLSQNADKADDLVQEALVKAWDKQESFQQGTNLKAWLFTILRNEFYSQMRKRGREVQDSDGIMTGRLAIHPSQHGSVDRGRYDGGFVQIHFERCSAVPARTAGASGVHQDAPHYLCGDGEKLRARLPFDVVHFDKADVDLVD